MAVGPKSRLNRVIHRLAFPALLSVTLAPWPASGGDLGDFDGDGKADVLLRHADGRWRMHLMNGRALKASTDVDIPADRAWQFVGKGDFDGDGRDDVLLRHTDGRWHYAPLDGGSVRSGGGSAKMTRNLAWSVAGIGDLDGDGRDDVLLRHTRGGWYYYPMNGRRIVTNGRGSANLTKNLAWRVAGVGDFNGDGKDDVLLRREDGRWFHYAMDGRRFIPGLQGSANLTRNPDWRVAGVDDLDGDGRDDVLLRRADGRWYYYPMYGPRFIRNGRGTANLTRDADYTVAGVGDTDGDGNGDVLLRHADGHWYHYSMDGRRHIPDRRGPAELTPDLSWGLPSSGPAVAPPGHYRVGQTFQDCRECPEMVVAPAGTFTMGSAGTEDGHWSGEGPRHPVTVAEPFAIGVHEVTFAEWDACVAAGGCTHEPWDWDWGRGRRPVMDITWTQTRTYVDWLSAETGQSYRLPSEAEWEYAARAGTQTPFHFGATISTDQANFDGIKPPYGDGATGVNRGRTVEVGSFPANAFGLHDVHGNVAEWVQDCGSDLNSRYDNAPADGSAVEIAGCSEHVARGGGWWDEAGNLRSARRGLWNEAAWYNWDLGFRVARSVGGTVDATPPTGAPANVRVTRLADGGLEVAWDPVPDQGNGGSIITGYVATATARGAGRSWSCRTDASGMSCVIKGLPRGTYDVTVVAVNDAGSGTASKAVAAETSSDGIEREIVVNVVGQGTVELAGTVELTCPFRNLCSALIPSGASVTLRAAPATAYDFDGWRGCDHVAGNECTVDLNEDRLIAADFLSNQPLTLRDDVVTFDSARVDMIDEFDLETGLMRLTAGADLADIETGAVLVSSVIDGGKHFTTYFLRRVQEVMTLKDGPTYVRTAPATIEELIAAGTLSLKTSLGADEVSSYVLPPGVRPSGFRPGGSPFLPPTELRDGRVEYRLAKPDRAWAGQDSVEAPSAVSGGRSTLTKCTSVAVDQNLSGLAVSGTLSLCLKPVLHLEMGGASVKEFLAQVEVEPRLDAAVTLGQGGFEKDWTIPMVLNFAPIPVGPVVWVPSVDLELVIKATATTSAGVDLSIAKVVTGGAHYSDGNWRVIRFHSDVSARPDFDGIDDTTSPSLNVEFGARSVFRARAYGVGGPVVAIGPYAAVSVFGLDPAKGDCTWDYAARVGLDGTFGAEIKFLSFKVVDYEQTLFDRRLTLPSRDCPDGDTMPPHTPRGLRFASVEQDRLVVVWDAVTDDQGGEVKYEVVRNSAEAGTRRSVDISQNRFDEFNPVPDAEYCYVVHAVDGADNHSGPSQEACTRTGVVDYTPPTPPTRVSVEAKSSTSIIVSWEESVDDGGVAHYVIVDVTGGGRADIGKARELSSPVAGLVPSTEYCFAIQAADEAGNLSELSTRACTTTLDPTEAEWRVRVQCTDSGEYFLEDRLDLDEGRTSVLSVFGEAHHSQSGTSPYTLTGTYEGESKVLDGVLDLVDYERTDGFRADLSYDDTGDIAMERIVSNAACPLSVRFDKPKASSVHLDPAVGDSGVGVASPATVLSP